MTDALPPHLPLDAEFDEVPADAPQTTAVDPLATRSNRRDFLRRASALTLVIPGLGAALTSCSSEEHGAGTAAARQGQARHDARTARLATVAQF